MKTQKKKKNCLGTYWILTEGITYREGTYIKRKLVSNTLTNF
jgi:hypothetical protein